MELTRLEIIGFKSFYNKTELIFGQGITAIVGPNGCGKSNVSEAIRWALGEQNSRRLRCEKMEEIIFAGTKNRPPGGMAEVSITFSNEQGALPVDLSEVTLTRRLFRSGESEYQINRKPCRLKDIVDMFMDTGMGTDAYSLLERDMVNSILSSRTEDRRYLFDEAAGIMKYKARRRSTLKNLIATENDLLRLDDIVGEVDKQIGSLKRQVKRAETYQRYQQDLVETETALAYGKYRQALSEEEPLVRQKQEFGDKLQGFSVSIEKQDADIEALRQQTSEREEEAVAARKLLSNISKKNKRLDDELLINRERQTALENQIARYNREIEQLKNRRGRLDVESIETERASIETKENIVELEKIFQTAKSQRNATTIKIKERERNIIGIENKTRTILRQRLGLENELKTLQQRDREMETQLQRFQRQLVQMGEERHVKSENLGNFRQDFDELQNAVRRLIIDLQRQTADMEKCRSKHSEVVARAQKTREQLASVRSNLHVLIALRDRYEGFEKGVRRLMTRKNATGLQGVLTDFISTDPKYETAIEAALGQKLQLIVTDRLDSVHQAATSLTKEKSGRACFFPITALTHYEQRQDAHIGDAVGRAVDLVRASENLQELIQTLLGDVWVTHDLQKAIELHERYPEGRFVTLNGEVVEKNGIIIAGYTNSGQDGSLLARKRRINALSKNKDSLLTRLKEYESQCRELDQETLELKREQKDIERELQSQRQKLQSTERQIHALSYQLETLDEREIGLAEMIAERKDNKKISTEKIRQLSAAFQKINEESRQTEETLQQHRSDLKIGRQKVGKLNSALNKAQIDLISIQGKLEKLESDRRRIEEATRDATRAIAHREKEATDADQASSDLKDRRAKLEILLEEQHKKEEKQSQIVNRLRDAIQVLTNRIRQIEQSIRQVRQDREKMQRQVHKIELRLAQLGQERRDVILRLTDEHQIDVTQIHEEPEKLKDWKSNQGHIDYDKGEQYAQELRQRIRSLGPVNLMAIDEYKRESERHKFLLSQKRDLEEAKRSLKTTLTQINKKARERFRETFEKIRMQFVTVFHTLFEGGEADLILEKNVDLLEAGIDIVARPKGKKLQSIQLLSAGERALVAISLLFAIYLVKPSPFCILDEIDAPLDDANIGRFTKILKQLTQRSQFVMITHNKRTVEIANRLYGVTMEEAGVSRLVSVKFESNKKIGSKPYV
ncbi:MAG: chromosome segregation protein SMC [Candidatus Cloacimonetes bacterium 4572_55]|nr:MAG: chromosome segregation protein SMC [Candidatus Cloacimonetes bacterium 4572_55]